MGNRVEVEHVAAKIVLMDRDELVQTLRTMQCEFKLDFTDDYLNSISLERLRHIVLAATLHVQ